MEILRRQLTQVLEQLGCATVADLPAHSDAVWIDEDDSSPLDLALQNLATRVDHPLRLGVVARGDLGHVVHRRRW